MKLFIEIVQVVLMVLVPFLLLKGRNTKLIKGLGTIGMAYALGIIFSLVVFFLNKTKLTITINEDVFQIGSYLAIGVAIPLLLFNTNIQEVKKLSKVVIKSFLSLVVCLLIVTTICVVAFKPALEESPFFGAMAVGLYTGGTPNLNAIGNIFHLSQDSIALANLSDILIGGVFYLFLLLFAKPLFKKYLKSEQNEVYLTEETNVRNFEDLQEKGSWNKKKLALTVLLAFGMALVSAAFGVVLWIIQGSKDGQMLDMVVPCLLIGVTLFGLIASFFKKVREVEGTNFIGQYLILVFSYALASSLDISKISSNFLTIFLFYSIITIGTFLLHTLVARALKVDIDCSLVVLTAGVYGPAFVPAIANQVKNKKMIAPGLIVGSLGYAIGTFLGLLFGLFFQWIL